MNLVVVESPAKAKTINKYLGKDYIVLASYGQETYHQKMGLLILKKILNAMGTGCFQKIFERNN